MTRQEEARMRRLETENAELRRVLSVEQAANKKMVWELVDLRVKIEMIESALRSGTEERQ